MSTSVSSSPVSEVDVLPQQALTTATASSSTLTLWGEELQRAELTSKTAAERKDL